MITINEPVLSKPVFSMQIPYEPEDVVYFDIETTGFSPLNTSVYLIGAIAYEKDGYHLYQWFADSLSDEKELLSSFMSFIAGRKAVVHYNGTGFDIPYIIKRCHMLSIPCDFGNINSIDIYKHISPIKNLLKLENLKQKSIEAFLGVGREDRYSGGDLIHTYHRYLETHEEELLRLLLLHNHDDVIGMTQIIPIMNYTCFLNKNYQPVSIKLEESTDSFGLPIKELFLELALDAFIPKRISFGNPYYYCTAAGDVAKLSVKVYTDELKYFYPNYKDYYYLPAEDRSIHKSVAFFVDKEFRTKAKAANCYSKKTGTFLPQFSEIISPYFKIDYYDKISYFEFTDDFRNNPSMLQDYLNHIFSVLIR